MGDTHVVDHGTGAFTVALHYPVPDLLNEAGVNYRDALVASGIGLQPSGRRTILDDINPAEEQLLDFGQLYEHTANTNVEPSAEAQAALYLLEQEEVFDFLYTQLANFGAPPMATYPELFDLRTSSDLQNRIAVAVIIKAEAYITAATPTADQLAWASRVLTPGQTISEARKLLHYLLGANKDNTVAQITGATDAQIQTEVDMAVDVFVTAGIVNGAP
jgi:hypothetical protein